MLVGNKVDMAESSRKTSREMGEAFAQEEGLLFTEASAKSGDGVEELFLEIGMFPISQILSHHFPRCAMHARVFLIAAHCDTKPGRYHMICSTILYFSRC